MASSEDILTIDWDSRSITIPSTITNIGVEHDRNTNRLWFKCPATYGEFNILDFGIRVSFGNYNSSSTEVSSDIYEVEDAEYEDDYIKFSWLVGPNAYQTKGKVYFIVCCKYTDSSGAVLNDLNTTLAYLPVLEGRECDTNAAIIENYYDLYLKLLALVEEAESGTTSSGTTGGDGVGIASVEQTTTSTESSGENVVTVTLTDDSTYTFSVYNGAQGEKGDTGDTGAAGSDYVLTDADKSEIAEIVLTLVEDGDEVSY